MQRWRQRHGNERLQEEEEAYETKALENSIYKICDLLAVGFGDAGAEVIAENMRRQGDLDPMVPGKLTVAIFGFCDIRNFTDATGACGGVGAFENMREMVCG